MEEMQSGYIFAITRTYNTHKCHPRGLINVWQWGREWEPITFIMSNVVRKLASVLLCES